MSEANARPNPGIDGVLERLSLFWHAWRPAVPSWVAQELTFGQLRILFRLEHDGSATMSQIAEWLEVTLPTATGIIERIERRGLVERRHGADDRRIVECALTARGEVLLAEIVGIRDEATRAALSVLTPDELVQVDDLLARIAARLRAQHQAETAPDLISIQPNPPRLSPHRLARGRQSPRRRSGAPSR